MAHARGRRRIAREGVVRNLPLRFRRKNGQEIAVLLTLVRSREGGETYLEGILADASEGRGACQNASGAAAMASSSLRV